MDKDVKITPEQLTKAMEADYQKLVQLVSGAVNGSPDGAVISGVTVHGNVFERCGAVIFGGVQIHGGKENLVDGNLFIDCHAGISFSRWGEKRWLDSIERFHKQAGEPLYSTRYPELARPDNGGLAGLRVDADINFISRNLFARCGSVFLRDGGVELMALNAVTGRLFEPQIASDEKSIRSDPQLKEMLFEPIPIEEIGPYTHPWRAQEARQMSASSWANTALALAILLPVGPHQ